MRDLRERLTAWTDAGLLGMEQAAAIERFEAERAASGEPWQEAAPVRQGAAPRRVAPAEAIGYVGAALAVGAVALMLGEIWDGFTITGQLVFVGLLAGLLYGAGVALRDTVSGPLQRLASVLVVGGVLGATWFAGILAFEALDLRWETAELVVAGVATAVAVPTYLWRRRGLPQLAAFGSLVALALVILSQVDADPQPWAYGLVVTTIGLAWLLLSLGGWLAPVALSGVIGGAMALLGMQIARFDWMGDPVVWPWLLVGGLLAAGLVGLALLRDAFHHLVVGAIGLFVFLPQLVFEFFGDTIGGPATMLVIGLLLVLLAVGIGRAGREVRGPRGGRHPSDDAPLPPQPTQVEEVSGR